MREGIQEATQQWATSNEALRSIVVCDQAGVGLTALLFTVAGAAVGYALGAAPHFPFNLRSKNSIYGRHLIRGRTLGAVSGKVKQAGRG